MPPANESANGSSADGPRSITLDLFLALSPFELEAVTRYITDDGTGVCSTDGISYESPEIPDSTISLEEVYTEYVTSSGLTYPPFSPTMATDSQRRVAEPSPLSISSIPLTGAGMSVPT